MADWSFFRPKLTPENKRLWNLFQFLTRLSILSLPLYVILEFGISLYQLQLMVADHMYWIFTSWGFPITREGVLFKITGESPFAFVISEDCVAWKSILLLFALLFAVPKVSNRKRLLGLAIGIPIIWLGNLSRIFGIVWTQQAFGTEAALFLHDVLWQLGLAAMVLVIWVVWMHFPEKRISLEARQQEQEPADSPQEHPGKP